MTLIEKLNMANEMLNKGYISTKTFETLVKGLYLIESDN